MNQSVQELTNKIYEEGVAKAEAKGAQIIEEARQKARKIVEQAEERHKAIIESAEQHALEQKAQIEAEIRLSARKSIGDLKQRINDLIIEEVALAPIENAMDDIAFVQKLIGKLLDAWIENFGSEEQLSLTLPESDSEEYQTFLKQRAAEFLKKGAEVQFSKKLPRGFQVEHTDIGFKISFTDEDFENYFRSFARARTYKMLFGESE